MDDQASNQLDPTESPQSTDYTWRMNTPPGTPGHVTVSTYPDYSASYKTTKTTKSWYFYSTSHQMPTGHYPNNEWGDFNIGVPITICVVVVVLLIVTVVIAKKRRGRLRSEGRQHPSRVISGGPAMSVDALRRYPGAVPQPQGSQGQGQRNEVMLVVDPDPAPHYPGPRELPPTYEEVMRMCSGGQQMLGNANLGYSHTSVQIDQPDGTTSQPATTPSPPTETSVQNPAENSQTSEEQSHNILNNSGNSSENSNGQSNSEEEKPEPEIYANVQDPKPD